MEHADDKTPGKETRLEKHLQALLGPQIRQIRVIYRNIGVVLQGSAHTYYAKQLAQYLVMETTNQPILANEIEVRWPNRRSDDCRTKRDRGGFANHSRR